MPALETLASIAGLVTFAGKLISTLNGLRGCGPKCSALIQSMQNLRDVLERVQAEYEKTLDMVNRLNGASSSLSITNSLLSRCLGGCSLTCRDFEAILGKISRSKVRSLKWRLAEGDLEHLATRLEGDKSTLVLLLASISEERQRCVDAENLKAIEAEKTRQAQVVKIDSPPPSYSTAVADGSGTDDKYLLPSTVAERGALCGGYAGGVLAAECLTNPFGWAALGIVATAAATGAFIESNTTVRK
ncbi:hypothetical protein NM208_g2332 [Fusarium decemcellulare]|uniref:Uncharacterized protein n=1 Tax=Fusarium decemcellulare TaxID=57161 RepID=A0ACC1ST35_9HYPO|nr:hypothetical protein NM208_g2332 [Fusarium decemcellulare]